MNETGTQGCEPAARYRQTPLTGAVPAVRFTHGRVDVYVAGAPGVDQEHSQGYTYLHRCKADAARLGEHGAHVAHKIGELRVKTTDRPARLMQQRGGFKQNGSTFHGPYRPG